ncbi:HNH endonuclease [Nonomuraea sp. NPDC051941]|uniref:HNH endonuclease n=1 Tax=Nonomuraea sp. NPDC051941 TaxID=3364373 RepID=UPI0037C6E503
MIRIVRRRLTSELEASLLKLTQEIANTPIAERIKHVQNMWDRRSVRRDVYKPVFEVLESMAPGLDCCMYCGDDLADTVDHFVPKVRCPIRSFYWRNLLLACSTCNSRYKKERYKSDGLVGSLLVDPTLEDPFDHLDLRLDSGLYRPVEGSPKGQWTIDVCGLNEGKRPRARSDAWLRLNHDLTSWDRARKEQDEKQRRYLEWVMRGQPFADVYHAALHKAVSEHAERIFFDASPGVLALLRDEDLRSALLPG